MSSIMSPQGVVLATAMAVSGTVILLALRLQKTPSNISSSDEGKKKEKMMMNKKKKKVHFAEDVVDPTGNSDEYRKLQIAKLQYNSNSSSKKNNKKMPENRVALYNGILRDRVIQKVQYSC